MIIFTDDIKKQLITLKEEKEVFLEGNIIKLVELDEGDTEFNAYIADCLRNDKDNRRRRLEITRQVQHQNTELVQLNNENERILKELQLSLTKVEEAKATALNDLDLLQKKKQTQLISDIVKVALGVIGFVAVITSAMYVFSIIMGKETTNIGQAWNNMFGILLTNAFSIVGTIMGVKYANKDKD